MSLLKWEKVVNQNTWSTEKITYEELEGYKSIIF